MTINSFTGHPADNQLEIIGKFLKEISRIPDVRHVMDRFDAYQARVENQRSVDARILTVKKHIGAKFMKTLNTERASSTGSSFFDSEDMNCGDTDENDEGEEVIFKLKMMEQLQEKLSFNELSSHLTLQSSDSVLKEDTPFLFKIPTDLPMLSRRMSFKSLTF